MEEKKLTDEEIVRALEHCCGVNGHICDRECVFWKMHKEISELRMNCQDYMNAFALDLIKRLQQRVSILEADNDDYKMKLAENELVSIDWHNEQVGHLEEENAELQKQVDELKAENGRLHKIIVEEMVSVKAVRVAKSCPTAMKMLAESVGCVQKDTAKEIIQWIKLNGILEYGGYVIHDSTIEQMCKKYGVEVE
jgi:hypothetical protein